MPLCTDDIAYQRFKVIRNPVLLGLIKRTPLSFRQNLPMVSVKEQ